ncbi:MAG TPA: hypothetical protein HPP87_12030 [Planctomycetes bacterium]|nr:hypothetical protein [Planctomycetota bacterium]
MTDNGIGYLEDPTNSNGIIRARTTKQIRSREIPRSQRALEKLNKEMGESKFPGNYVLFEGTKKIYTGEAGDVYRRLKSHLRNPEEKIKGWDKALILNDGRPATQSDFNDPAVRLAIEMHLIKLFKANKYHVVAQGREPSLTATQKRISDTIIQELSYFLLKKNIITRDLQEQGQEEVFRDELKKLLGNRGQNLGAYEATIDGETAYIRPGSLKTKGWQITFRDRFLNSLERGTGYLLVSRDGVPLIPLREVRKAIKDKEAYKQNTIDVYLSFTEDKVTLM